MVPASYQASCSIITPAASEEGRTRRTDSVVPLGMQETEAETEAFGDSKGPKLRCRTSSARFFVIDVDRCLPNINILSIVAARASLPRHGY